MKPIVAGVAAAVLWSIVLPGAVRAEATKDDWFDDACVDKTEARWCAPKLRAGSWTLKYRTESPKDLAEVFWRIEVWVKGSDALVCELKGGRGGLRSNGCYSLTEVSK